MSENKAQLPIQRSHGGSMAIIPQSIEQVWRIADAMVAANMVPHSLKGKEQVVIAMLHGMELGMTPMAAVQSIAVINGSPCLYGDGLLGVVRASGLLEYCKEWTEEVDGVPTAFCEVQRKGEPEPVLRSFSQADAERAKLDKKTGPWTQGYAGRMRQMRARSWALRDTFADVLKGIQTAEEVMDRGEPRDVTPEPPAPPKPKAVEPPPPPPEEPEPEGEAMTTEELTEHIDACLAVAADIETLDETWEDRMAALGEEMNDEASAKAREVYDRHVERIDRAAEEPGLPLEANIVAAG